MAGEQYQEWLERLEVPVEATSDITTFQDWLEDEIMASDRQVRELWDAAVIRYEELAPIGVRPISIDYPWGTELRWAITGAPGLWGWEGMKEETGWEP